MSEVAIKVEHVSKNFVLPHEKIRSVKSVFMRLSKWRRSSRETQHALKDVSFEVKKGEFFGIVGRNGSGKSTMLKMLANIYQPTKGKVHTYGKLVPFIELGVGFNPELTGRENVYLNGAMLGFSRKEIAAMYDDIVAFAELERFMDQKLKNYSSGMQVRLAFSMATRSRADILLVDEVLAVGDADFQRKCYDYFKSLKKNRTTVVFVSHDMNAVREFCDRVVLIDDNQLKSSGDAESIAQQYYKLFTASEPGLGVVNGPGGDRWGEKQVEISSVKSNKKTYTGNDKDIVIKVTFIAQRPYDELVCGIGIKDGFGRNIYGTNTYIKNQKIPSLRVGQSRTITWVCPNILADGKHTVDVALHDSTGLTVYDWWNSVLEISVRREEKTLYPISPEIAVKID